MFKKASLTIAVLVALLTTAAIAGSNDIAWDKIIGAKAANLSAQQKDKVAANLAKISNTHGCTGTIKDCLAKGDMTARRHAGFVVRMVQKNKSDEVISKGIAKRHESAFPEETFDIDLRDHPVIGNPDAKVVFVEYACFECPFCAHLAPKLKELKKRFGSDVAYYYKFFPVRSHPRGVASALAGLAAKRQGKFWEMYSLMYANRTDLGDEDLLRYAKEVGLDVAKFTADIKDKALMSVLQKDKLEGMRFGVEGTPTFFVNGKMYQGRSEYADIADRIAEELDIVNGKITK